MDLILSMAGLKTFTYVIGAILFLLIVYFIVRDPQYEYINGVVEKTQSKPGIIETKHEEVLYENPLITYLEIRIHLKKGTYEINKDGKWILLSKDQIKEVSEQFAQNVEHPVITLV